MRLWKFENCAVISPQCNGGDGFQGGHLRAYYNRSQKTRPAWVCLDASQDPRRVGVKLEISEPPKRKYVFYFLSLWSQLFCSVNYQTRNSNLDERPTLMYSTTTIHFTTKIWTTQKPCRTYLVFNALELMGFNVVNLDHNVTGLKKTRQAWVGAHSK